MEICLTDNKILVEWRLAYCQIYYNNISTIQRGDERKEHYSIEVTLVEPVENNPYGSDKEKYQLQSKMFHITGIPKGSNFYDILLKLYKRLKGMNYQ